MGCVFVIDDEESLRSLMHRAIERVGFDVREYGTLDQALKEIDEYKPSVVVLDLNMPGLSIWDYVTSLANMSCAVIVYSGCVTENDHIELLKKGAMWVLSKPLSPTILAEYVRKAERFASGLRVMRKLQPATRDLKERLQKSSDALAEFTTRLRNEPSAQAT
jgi:DNA-binding response OmpR family regulator